MDIPESVVAAAEYVASWASENSRGDSWEIGRCASRHELIRLRAKNERLRFAQECVQEGLARIKEKCQTAERLWEVGEVVEQVLEGYTALAAKEVSDGRGA